MFMFSVFTFCMLLAAAEVERVKRSQNTGNTNTCTDDPIEFAIGIDASRSISQDDFKLALDFILNLVGRYDIGDGKESSRVAVFSYGTSVYTQDAFGLNLYLYSDDLENAVKNIKHKFSAHTDTAKAIDYIHDTVLSQDNVRTFAQKVGIIITDGSSKNHTATALAADAARKDGIILLAIGIGEESAVSNAELLSVAGNSSRVLRLLNYSSLVNVGNLVRMLSHQTCTTRPTPTEPPCGKVNPTDVVFVFSPVDLHYNVSWPSRFIKYALASNDFKVGFQVALMDCSVGIGTYDNLNDVDTLTQVMKTYAQDLKNGVITCPGDEDQNHTRNDGHSHLPDIVQRLIDDDFSLFKTSRRPVVVIISDYREDLKDKIGAKAKTLSTSGAVEVFIALTSASTKDVTIFYDFQVFGRTPEEQAETFIYHLCP